MREIPLISLRMPLHVSEVQVSYFFFTTSEKMSSPYVNELLETQLKEQILQL